MIDVLPAARLDLAAEAGELIDELLVVDDADAAGGE
jgi:hypothetical protein